MSYGAKPPMSSKTPLQLPHLLLGEGLAHCGEHLHEVRGLEKAGVPAVERAQRLLELLGSRTRAACESDAMALGVLSGSTLFLIQHS